MWEHTGRIQITQDEREMPFTQKTPTKTSIMCCEQRALWFDSCRFYLDTDSSWMFPTFPCCCEHVSPAAPPAVFFARETHLPMLSSRFDGLCFPSLTPGSGPRTLPLINCRIQSEKHNVAIFWQAHQREGQREESEQWNYEPENECYGLEGRDDVVQLPQSVSLP